jgi:hypothetical protein
MTIAGDFKYLLFTIYRILPFVVVAFFFISAIISGDLSGFLILVGIILSSVITIVVSKTQYLMDGIFNEKINGLYDNLPQNIKDFATGETPNDSNKAKIIKSLKHCNVFSLGESPLSYLPLSTHTYWFVFGYFVFVMATNNVLAKNWFLLLTMVVTLFVDAYYNRDACVGNYIVAPILIGLISGISWALIVGPKNHMIPMVSKSSQCGAQKSKFSCRIKRTGELISTK